jgi:hypothetical protein
MNSQIAYGARMFDAVQAVFSGSLDIRFQPEKSAGEGEVALGILKSPIAKSFYSEAREIALLMCETCDATEVYLKEMQMLQDLYSRLFWTGVYSQFPRVGFGIRDGWKVVALGDVPQPTFDPESPALTFFEDVRKGFLAKNDTPIGNPDPYLDPVTNESEEYILGKVNSPELKALFLVKVGLSKAVHYIEQEFLSLSAEPSLDTTKSVAAKCFILSQQINLVDHLFWLGVQKQLPSVAKGNNFAIRRGWDIVRIPKDVGSDLYMLAAIEMLQRCRYED